MERAGDVGQNDADHIGAAGNQAAGQQIGAVSLFLAELQDALPGLRTDLRRVVDGSGNSGHGNARHPGNVFDRYTPHEKFRLPQ